MFVLIGVAFFLYGFYGVREARSLCGSGVGIAWKSDFIQFR